MGRTRSAFILTNNLFRDIFKKEQEQIFSIKNVSLLHPLIVKFTFDYGYDGAYTRPLKQKKTYRICIGGAFIRKALDLQDRIAISDVNVKLLKEIDWLIRGLYYHEAGHLRYTDMKDRRIIDYSVVELRPFIKKLANILEDIAQETFGMSKAFPYTKKYFRFLVNKVFIPKCSKYEDKEDASSFLSFLLLKLRCGKKFLGSNKFYDDNEAILWPMIKDVLIEPSGTERITKTITLAEWIINNAPFDCKDVSNDVVDVVDIDNLFGGDGLNCGTWGQDSSYKDEFNPKSLDELDSKESSVDIKETYDPVNDPELKDLQEVTDSLNDVLGCVNHYEIIANQYFLGSDPITQLLKDRLVNYGSLIIGIKDAIFTYQSRVKPKMTPGFSNGKLSVKSVMKSKASGVPNPKPFMKKVETQLAPDLALYVVVDNSGSMGHNKSYICTNATLSLVQACELVHIPIEVACFTEGASGAVTIRMKSFEDTFEQALPYFGIIDYDLCKGYTYDRNEIPLFCGNIDEVNIYHIWKRFQKYPHRNKLMIVISDGETCGSSEDLRNLVRDIEASGIHVIGLGIQSFAAASIYPDCKTFLSAESLNELPEFMTDLLLKYSRGGK